MVAHGLRILNYCLPDGRGEGRRREGVVGEEEEEGASKQHIYICISTLDLVIRQKTNCLQKHSRGIASITYFPAAQTLANDSPHLFFVLFFFLSLFFLSEAYLNLPGQLVDCGEFCARLASIYLDIITRQFAECRTRACSHIRVNFTRGVDVLWNIAPK